MAPALPSMRQIEGFLPCCFLREKKHAAAGELQTSHHDACGHDGLGMVHTQMAFQLLYKSIAS